MEDKKITFDELLNMEWKYCTRNERDDLHLKVYDNTDDTKKSWQKSKGVLVNFEQCWADHHPTSHELSQEDNLKVASMFLYTKDMYKLLSSMDSPEAKELIKKINETNPLLNEEEDDE